MKGIKLILVIVLFINEISATAQESNNKHKTYIEIGICSGAHSKSFMGGVFGAAGIVFTSFGRHSAIDLRGKESYIVSPERETDAFSLTYRIFFTKGFYVGIGGAHNHEIAIKYLAENPVGAILATDRHIIHRTGIIGEVGYDFRSFIKKGGFGIYPVINLSAAYMPDDEPNPLVNLSVGFRFGFKRRENL